MYAEEGKLSAVMKHREKNWMDCGIDSQLTPFLVKGRVSFILSYFKTRFSNADADLLLRKGVICATKENDFLLRKRLSLVASDLKVMSENVANGKHISIFRQMEYTFTRCNLHEGNFWQNHQGRRWYMPPSMVLVQNIQVNYGWYWSVCVSLLSPYCILFLFFLFLDFSDISWM